MFQSGSSTGDITSHYFNITEPAAAATSPSASESSTSVTFSSGSATSSPSSITDKKDNNSGGIPGGTVAGIAVGAALGAFAIAGLAGWMLWRRRKTRGKNAGASGSLGLVQENKISDEKEYYAGPVSGGGVSGRYELDDARQGVYRQRE
ncbi:hypothetical protein CDEST_14366 [Colletotrichum destructivum]|uniref:Uncharacterized protein n=1 Tax=Colletotrichum destructivum TaxID=34406 RepID=A0AAX4J1P1_9PEZI|nr:hypothetical protein CDEST_14366 [Colletotrichum destructivum]